MQFHAQSDILLQPFWLPDGGYPTMNMVMQFLQNSPPPHHHIASSVEGTRHLSLYSHLSST